MNIFNFERMFSTQIIKVVYILGLIGIVISAILFFLFAPVYRSGGNGAFLNVIITLGILVFGALLWRIICEGLIVIFLIYDKLADIKELLKK